MKLLIQRVARGAVHIGEGIHSQIGRGLVLLLGVQNSDTDASIESLAKKVTGLRIFDDAAGKTNLSCEDVSGEYLVVSQFTLCADLSKGKRPGFEDAMKPPRSKELYELFCRRLVELTGRPVKTGEFGATMRVEIHNDGPATYWVQV